MKFTGILSVTLSLFAILFGPSVWAGNTVANGGDVVASQFGKIAHVTITKAITGRFPKKNRQIITDLKAAVLATRISTEEVLHLDSYEVDAINYPEENRIVVSRSRWKELRRSEKELLVIHEYLWLAGYDDSSYQLSLEIHQDYLSSEVIIIPNF